MQGEESIDPEDGVGSGVGDCTVIFVETSDDRYGILWGSGEISIVSFTGQGEDEGIGGVMISSVLL